LETGYKVDSGSLDARRIKVQTDIDIGSFKCGACNPGAMNEAGGDKKKAEAKGKAREEDEEESSRRNPAREPKEYCQGALQTRIYFLREKAGLVSSSQARTREPLLPYFFVVPRTSSFICSAIRNLKSDPAQTDLSPGEKADCSSQKPVPR